MSAIWRLLTWIVLAAPAAGQAQTQPAQSADALLVDSVEESIWLARTRADGGMLFHRKLDAEAFDLGRSFSGAAQAVWASGDAALLVFADGAIYLFTPTTSTLIPPLPQRATPLAAVSLAGVWHALVDASIARALDSSAGNPALAGARYAVVRFDGSAWLVAAAVPADVSAPDAAPGAALTPQLTAQGDRLLLTYLTRDGVTLITSALDEEGSFSTLAQHALADELRGFWVLIAERTPVLVLLRGGSEPWLERLAALRLLGRPDGDGQAAWQPAELTWRSGALDEVTTLHRALGFNQSVGVLVDRGQAPYLLMAGLGREALEPDVALQPVLNRPLVSRNFQGLVQMLALLALVLVLVGLMVFRRDGMVKPVVLPDGLQIGLLFQRQLSGMIDLAVFVVAAAQATGVDVRGGLEQLVAWSLTSTTTGRISLPALAAWWGLAIGGYTLYSFILEALTGRSVGKVLLGLRVSNEQGTPASVGAIAIRNAFRLVELMPPLWLMALLVLLLSRNRQRLGDIFARTLVVRPTPPPLAGQR